MGRKSRNTKRRQRGGYEDAPPSNLYTLYTEGFQPLAETAGFKVPNFQDLTENDWKTLRKKLSLKFHSDKYSDQEFANDFMKYLNEMNEYMTAYFQWQNGGKKRRRKTRRRY